ncbi:MAG TPA: AI-2E family transporter [Candidatus Paceibacterota bacterium]|nr:AI-2E family transporter [Candidatus Paceibacterota bacterium]
MSGNSQLLDISWATIVKLGLTGFLVYAVFSLRDLLVLVLFGVILSILFDPVIDFLQTKKIPRVVSTIGVYLLLFSFLSYVIFATTPIFVTEIQEFSHRLPQYFEERINPSLEGLGVSTFKDFQSFVDVLTQKATEDTSTIFEALVGIFGGIFSTVFVISVSIFLSIEDRPIERTITLLFPKKYEALALSLWKRSQRKVSGWFLSRVLSSIFVAAATYFTLLLFGVHSPLSLSLLAGVLNFVPVVGPLLAGVLIALLVALESPLQALFVILAFVLIQQVEENVLMPLLSKRLIGVPPALVLISLAIGAHFWGIMGAILAIPLAGIFFEFLRDFLKKQKEEKTVVL